MRRPTTTGGLLAAAAIAALFAPEAKAHIFAEWQPRVSLAAGYDDNILLDGNGGDSFGQVLPGLKLQLFGDHGLRSTVDCQVGLSRLMHPEEFQAARGDLVVNQMCDGDFRTRTGTRSAFRMNLRTQYSQDPFSIANLGLLLRPGQTQIFYTRAGGEFSYHTSLEGTLLFGLDETSLYFSARDPGNGMMVAPHVAYEHRFTARDSWSAGLRESAFFSLGQPEAGLAWGDGITGLQTTALAGYKHKFSPITELSIAGGPALLSRPNGSDVVPVGRADLEMATPTSGLHATLMHDLVLGPSQGGPLLGDLAELAVSGKLSELFDGHVRGGVYRNASVGQGFGAMGFSAGAGLDLKLGRAWVLGAIVGREARLGGDAIDRQVDRDVVQLRLTWAQPREW